MTSHILHLGEGIPGHGPLSLAIRRFENTVSPEPMSGCWLWTGAPCHEGYGRFWFRGELWRPHRVAWAIYRGEIPRGLYVLHRCDNRGCVNPEHLFLGTHLDNVRDMLAKGRGSKPPNRWAIKGTA